ncbi:hypothetical protein BJ973_000886 [Actinoplanes tereljensis]|nr:hypothetical protein [Actinoplanes tereljensis]
MAMIAPSRPALRSAARWATVVAVAAVAGASAGFAVLVGRPDAGRGQVTAAVTTTTTAAEFTAAPSQMPTAQPTLAATHSSYDLAKPGAAAVAVPLGSAVTLHDGETGEPIEISVVKVTDPFDYPKWPALTGYKWVVVKVHIHNIGTGQFIAEPQKDALAIDTQGRWFEASGPLTAGLGSLRFQIAPNFDADSVVAFHVRETAEIDRIRLTLNAGTPTETADWTVT